MRGLGNIKMKGKKFYLPSCGCCVFFNFKEKELKKEHLKELRKYK